MKSFKTLFLVVSVALLLQGCPGDSDSDPIPPKLPDINSEVVGVWTSDETDSDLLAITFFEDGSYVHVEVDEKPPIMNRRSFTTQIAANPDDGMEWGKYDIDNRNGLLEASQLFDDNGDSGLSSTNKQFIKVTGDKLTIQIDENDNGIIDDDESFSFSRNKTEGSLGFWRSNDSDEELSGLAFFEDGTYINVRVDEDKTLDNPENGMEWGNYTISDEGSLLVTQFYDDNGSSGLSNNVIKSIELANGKLIIGIDVDGDNIIRDNEKFTFLNAKPEDDTESKKLLGLWTNKDTNNDLLALAFFDDGTYVHLEVDEALPLDTENEISGMEWGTYSVDSQTNALTINTTFDRNGNTGLSDPLTRYARVSGDLLTLQVDENKNGKIDSDESFTLSKAKSEGILGLWRNKDTNNELLLLAFLDDDTYIHLEIDERFPFDNDDNEISGMEWGRYTLNNQTKALNTSIIFDNNGSTGLSDSLTRYAKVSGNNLALEVDENSNNIIESDESFNFQRQ